MRELELRGATFDVKPDGGATLHVPPAWGAERPCCEAAQVAAVCDPVGAQWSLNKEPSRRAGRREQIFRELRPRLVETTP